MIIEFSLELLEKLKLTPNEYFIIILIKQKEFGLITKFTKELYTGEQTSNVFKKLITSSLKLKSINMLVLLKLYNAYCF